MTVVLLSRPEAEAITADILAANETAWALVYRAYQGEAWRAMGYKSWTAYVEAELQISRGYSYRLLQQAKANEQLSAAAGGTVRVSENTARVIGKRLPEVVEAIHEGIPAEAAVASMRREQNERASVTRSRFNDGGSAERFDGFTDDEPAPAHEHLWTVCRVCGEARA